MLLSPTNSTMASLNDSQTLLHIACQSQKASLDLVKYCIQMTKTILSWDMANHQDMQVKPRHSLCVLEQNKEQN